MSEQETDHSKRTTELLTARKRGIQQGMRLGLEQGIQQGIELGLRRGIEQGIQQGIEQGIERGKEQGIEIGLQQGTEQGMKLGREQGIVLGLQQAIKSWLGFRKNAIPNMRKAYMIGEVIKTFGIDEDLATKIVGAFFNDTLVVDKEKQAIMLEQKQQQHTIAEAEPLEAEPLDTKPQNIIECAEDAELSPEEIESLKQKQAAKRERDAEQIIKSWLNNRADITPTTERAPLISAVATTFKLDRDIATKIINKLFDEKFNN